MVNILRELHKKRQMASHLSFFQNPVIIVIILVYEVVCAYLYHFAGLQSFFSRVYALHMKKRVCLHRSAGRYYLEILLS